MTPEREEQLFSTLQLIVTKVTSLETRMDGIEARLHTVEARLDTLQARVETLDGDIRELKGQQSIMLVWLQSMDQRFGALMAPVTPPKKPAA